MTVGACIVVPPVAERPIRHTGAGITQANPVLTPSVVECMGRTTSIAFSGYNGDIIVGGDVAPPQRWNEPAATFRGFAAGGASDGSIINYKYKKTVGCVENATHSIWLAGSNGGGGILSRAVGATKHTLRTTLYYGEVQDGGSADPRRTKSRTILQDGTTDFVACKRSSGSPAWGVARSTDSGVNWTAWSFGTGRNYTAMVKSPQYSCIYAAADNREGSGNDGVFIFTGLGSGSATVTRIDNIGTGAPTIADARDVWVGHIGTTDYLFVQVGNKAGSDADRGTWRCKINADPTGGGFGAGNITWEHIHTPGSADRVNAIVGFQPNAGASPIYLMSGYFKSSTNATGTYTLSPGAGGTVKTYRVMAVRTLNGDATTPSWDVVSNATNVDMRTYGTDRDHVMTYVGETSNENSRFGGTSYSIQDMAISANGLRIVVAGKSSPWICDNPWATTPTWRPFSKGLGVLEGGYASTYAGKHRFAIADDDRGMYTFTTFGYLRPEWVIAENIDGVVSTANAMNSVAVAADGVSLLSPRDADGRSYITTDPWTYEDAFITALYTSSRTAPAICTAQWVDATATTRTLEVTRTAIYRDGTQVATIASAAATRAEFLYAGATCWLHVPDLGVYRSTNNGASWTLWWNYAVSDSQTAKYSGHIAHFPGSTTLYAAFDAGGVWRCTDADVSDAGTGLSGSRPTSTNLITGGALPSGTEDISAIGVDQVSGTVYACGYSRTGAALGHLYRLTRGLGSNWVRIDDTEYSESCLVPQFLTAYGGWVWISTASNCTLRRMF
ncbi:MAG TPA: hypothetical protein VNC22_23200 [Sporichthya sp.]|nr:hypothetical protein [Sporichthya sp.]